MTEANPGAYYAAYELNWNGKPCRYCKQPAAAHAYLYVEPPPREGQEDKREPVGDTYMHDGRADCTGLTDSEKARRKSLGLDKGRGDISDEHGGQ